MEKIISDSVVAEMEKILKENVSLKQEKSQIFEKVKLLMAKVSHEFKTPLNSIMGFTELIKNNSYDKRINEYANIILNCSEHMLTLIQNIIDVSCSKYKPIELSFSIFNTYEPIKDIINEYPTSKIHSTLINTTIVADYMRFKQLVINLISNAVKFGNNKPIKIITYIENNMFCCEISDRGEGISEDNLNKVFDIFSQVSENKDKRLAGTGIGLALCKNIVESHGGEISVQSNKTDGTTFCFKLPLKQ